MTSRPATPADSACQSQRDAMRELHSCELHSSSPHHLPTHKVIVFVQQVFLSKLLHVVQHPKIRMSGNWSSFYRHDALPVTKLTALKKYWRKHKTLLLTAENHSLASSVPGPSTNSQIKAFTQPTAQLKCGTRLSRDNTTIYLQTVKYGKKMLSEIILRRFSATVVQTVLRKWWIAKL